MKQGLFFFWQAHLIFMNAKYSNIRKAKQKPGGLAVIGVMMEVNTYQLPVPVHICFHSLMKC